MSLICEDLSPVMSYQGRVRSGVLWHALYGWKGAPVFDRHCLLIPFAGKSLHSDGTRWQISTVHKIVGSVNVVTKRHNAGRILSCPSTDTGCFSAAVPRSVMGTSPEFHHRLDSESSGGDDYHADAEMICAMVKVFRTLHRPKQTDIIGSK